jgi:hypothetical protein
MRVAWVPQEMVAATMPVQAQAPREAVQVAKAARALSPAAAVEDQEGVAVSAQVN